MKKTPLKRTGWIKRKNKFGAVASHDLATGRSFDSLSERARLGELEMLERGGVISGLVFKPPAVVLDAAAGIKWRIDYCYTENGRTVFEDWKPRPFTARENMLVKMWKAHGPGLLKITGGRKSRTVTLRTIMPEISPG